jgi:dihydrofolate reductase
MHFGDEAIGRELDGIMSGKFDLLLGRRTYDIWAGYWPKHGDNPIGKAFNQATKYVVTHRPKSLGWKTSKSIGGDIVKEIRRLRASKGPELHVWGSSELLQTLIAAGLVDEHRLWICPVVLGKGKRLFASGLPAHTLTLVDTRRASTGVLLNTYRPAGPLSKAGRGG